MTPTTDPARRARVYLLDPSDLARSADDPGLAVLLSEGWRVVAHFAVASRDREGLEADRVALVLAPPPVPFDQRGSALTSALPLLLALLALAVAVVALLLGP